MARPLHSRLSEDVTLIRGSGLIVTVELASGGRWSDSVRIANLRSNSDGALELELEFDHPDEKPGIKRMTIYKGTLHGYAIELPERGL